MKRWIPRIAICLLLGLITTIAVAWGFAVWAPITNAKLKTGQEYVQDLSGMRSWMLYHRRNFGLDRFVAMAEMKKPRLPRPTTRPGLVYVNQMQPWWSNLSQVLDEQAQAARDEEAIRLTKGDKSRVSPTVLYDDARGWPLVAFWCHWDSGMVPDGPKDGKELHGGIELKPAKPQLTGQISIDDQRALPYRPIWLGLVVDVLFYSLIWFLLLGSIGLTRNALRRAKGCCIKCGYDLRGLDHVKCPECGTSTQRGK